MRAAPVRTALVLVLAVALAGSAGAQEPPPAPPLTPVAVSATPHDFYARPWVGASLVSLGTLDAFAKAGVTLEESTAWQGAAETSRTLHSIRWALADGFEAGYRVDPLVTVAVRVGELRTEQGSLEVDASGPGAAYSDTWTWRTNVLMMMGGAGFTMPVTDASRVRMALFLGTGSADLSVARSRLGFVGGANDSLQQGRLDATGTMFVPEFSADYDYDLSPEASCGLSLGYRFGGVDSFVNTTPTQIDGLTGTLEQAGGEAVRDGLRQILSADFSGLTLAFTLTVRL